MKTPEAIKELYRYVKEPYSQLHPYFTDAVQAGIHALEEKQVRERDAKK